MTSKPGENMLRVIRAAAHRVRDEGVSDADLLAQYAAERDELAFATLVRRHARMVLGVAERVLGQEQDAEDVCQATFLLLAQKACHGLRRQSIAGWLCATARLTALNARKTKMRRTRTETRAGARTVKQLLPTPLERMSAAELVSALDEELACLPDRYRGPLVLCCLEGLARDEAARRLGVPLGTMRIQLERARHRLRAGLEKRGIELGAALVAVLAGSAAGTARAQLVQLVLAAVEGPAAPAVVTLCKGITAMTKTKLLLATVLAGALAVAAGVGALAKLSPPAKAAADDERRSVVLEPTRHPDRKAEKVVAQEPGWLQGRCTAADTGKPVVGVTIRVSIDGVPGKKGIVEVRSDADGRYALKMPLGSCRLFGVFAPAGYYTQDSKTYSTLITTRAKPRVERDFVLQLGKPWQVELQGKALAAKEPPFFTAVADPERPIFRSGETIQARGDAHGKAVLTIPPAGGHYRFACEPGVSPAPYEIPPANLEIDREFDPRQIKGAPEPLPGRKAVRLLDAGGRHAVVEGAHVIVQAGHAVLRFHAQPTPTTWALSLRGTVADEAGKPIAGAQCTAAFTFGRSARLSHLQARTDAKGQFAMRAVLLPQSYFGPDSRISMIVVKAGRDGAQTRELNLREIKQAGHGDFGTVVLKPGHILHGKVIDEKGRPLQGAAVTNMTNYFLYGHLQCRTDAEGRFVMPDLSYGTQKISARYGERAGQEDFSFGATRGECVVTARLIPQSGLRLDRRGKPRAGPTPAQPPADAGAWDLTPPRKEPKYRHQPRYALLVFGPKRQQRVWMVLDGKTLYVDRNADGDLTEPGDRLEPHNPTDGSNRFEGSYAWTHFDVFEFTVRAGANGTSRFQLDHWIRAEHFTPQTAFDKEWYPRWQKLRWENSILWRKDGLGQGQTQILFMPKPADAQVCKLDGPLTFAVKLPQYQILQRGEAGCDLAFYIIVPGHSPRGTEEPSFNRLATTEVPAGAHLEVLITYPAKTAGGTPLRRKYLLKQRC